MADTNDLLQQIRTIVREVNEPLKQGQKRLEEAQAKTNKDLQDVRQTQGEQKTILEAVLAGQQELQKTAAREVTVMKLADRLTRKVNDYEERITELEKEAGIPHPHKH